VRRPATPQERFVGRITQLGMLVESHPPRVIHVVGPHGAGKSAFLTELARHQPGRVAIGHGGSSTGALRLSWLQTALTELGAEPDVRAVVDAAEPDRPLGRDQLAIIGGAFDGTEPVFLCVDDAGDLDSASVAELGWLSHHVPAVRIVLTYAYPSEISGKPVAGLGTPVVLRLHPLTAEELRPLGVENVLDETGGIPALVAVLRRPREIALSVAMQIARLRTRWMPVESWEVLRLCAALGPLRAADIVQLTGRSTTDVLICIDRLVHAHLLREDPDGRVRHSSTLIREAVAEQVSGASSRHLKEQLAAASS
jgi:hypothetical protein